MKENKEYCHGFFGSTALLRVQGHQYEVGVPPEVLVSSYRGLMKPFPQPNLLFLRPLVKNAYC